MPTRNSSGKAPSGQPALVGFRAALACLIHEFADFGAETTFWRRAVVLGAKAIRFGADMLFWLESVGGFDTDGGAAAAGDPPSNFSCNRQRKSGTHPMDCPGKWDLKSGKSGLTGSIDSRLAPAARPETDLHLDHEVPGGRGSHQLFAGGRPRCQLIDLRFNSGLNVI